MTDIEKEECFELKDEIRSGPRFGRIVWAIVAFNLYSLVLIEAFMYNTLYLFDAELLETAKSLGPLGDLDLMGWGDHYIWRIIAAIIVTGLVGFFAGAIARKKGGIIAAVANIPSIAIWGVTFYIAAFAPGEIEGQTGFIVISLIAIPLTTSIAYYFGKVGAQVQSEEFKDDTVLAIHPYHWIWAIIPIGIYSRRIIFVGAQFLKTEFLTFRDLSAMGALINFGALIPVFAYVAPLCIAYKILRGDMLSTKGRLIKSLANLGVLSFGFVIALLIEGGVYWLLDKISNWWYG